MNSSTLHLSHLEMEVNNIYDESVTDDGVPEEVELLLKDMDITKKHLEQLAFLIRKYKSRK